MHQSDLSRATWRKSSRSNGSGGACVEVAGIAPVIAIRDSKDPNGPVLAFTRQEWHAFTRQVKLSRFDLT
jgi:uncharacterized protein DUF397